MHQRPALLNHQVRQNRRKAVLRCQRSPRLSMSQNRLNVTTIGTEVATKHTRHGQDIGMRQLLGDRQLLAASPQSLVRIAELPECIG
jgi:uncharacterized protein (DUF3084 family)